MPNIFTRFRLWYWYSENGYVMNLGTVIILLLLISPLMFGIELLAQFMYYPNAVDISLYRKYLRPR